MLVLLKKTVKRPYFLSSLKVCLIFICLFQTNHQVLWRIENFFEFKKYFALTVFSGIWLAAMMAIIYLAFTPAKMTRIIWALLIATSTLCGDLYFEIVQEPLTFNSLQVLWSSFRWYLDSGDLGDMVYLYGKQISRTLFYSTFLALAIGFTPPHFQVLNWRPLKLLPFIPYFLIIGIIYYSAGGLELETKGVPSQFYNLSLATIFTATFSDMPIKREVEIPLIAESPTRHIVLIVDESIRGDFIDLNTNRNTTPFLVSQDSLIANFGLAISGSNCTNASNAILRLGADPKKLGKQKILENPSVWKYAQKAGFETTYMLAYHKPAVYQNYMNEAELKLIDHYVSVDQRIEPQLWDHELAKQLIKILKNSAPQFIYINKRGSHFPYATAHPEAKTIFTPCMTPKESISTKERLVNSYKNAIRWVVDGFFERLIPEIDLEKTLIIYTSDHGQNLLDDGKLVTHCRRISPTLNEAISPLFIMTKKAELLQEFRIAAHSNFDKTSHFQIFPTVLTLFGYDEKRISEIYYQSLFEPVKEPLGFTSGIITGLFGRLPTWNPRDGIEAFKN